MSEISRYGRLHCLDILVESTSSKHDADPPPSQHSETPSGRRSGDKEHRDVALGLPHLVFRSCGNGERCWSGPQWQAYAGLSQADSLGLGWLAAIHPEDRALTMEEWQRAGMTGAYHVEHRILQAGSGRYRWHQTRAVPLAGMPAQEVEWGGASTDIDDAHRQQEALAASVRDLRTLMEGVPQLIWRSHARGDWTWASPQWLAYTGQQQQESHGLGWLAAVHPDDHAATVEAWKAMGGQGELSMEFRVRHAAEGTWVWHRTRSLPVRDRDGHIAEWLGTTTDIHALKTLQQGQTVLLDEARRHALELEDEIRQRRLVEAELLYTAFHDDLTRLHNRAYFIQHLTLALERMRASPGVHCAVLFLDLDRFKLVNDSLGHKAGDLLLREAALRLEACVGEQGTLARLGGDEFAVLVEDAGTMGDMVTLATGIIDTMARPFWLGRQEIFASCSVGLAQATSHHRLPEELLRDADIAMYHAKRHGTGGWSIFTDSMHDSAVEALQLQTDLRHAVSRGELVLHYQPICDARTGAITGLEALVRWQHPHRGLVPPGAFIPVAEDTGMVRAIGRWVLQEACGALRLWRERFPGLELRLGVNVSGEELRDSAFVAEVCDTLAATGIPPSALELEVTESVFLDQPDCAGTILGSLRGKGVRVALDDFGTGYSSLSYLDQYPMDTIKIDRSFVARMATQPRSVAIVDTIVMLGRAMGLAIIAEGIEEPRQLQLVQDAGCEAVQGYLLGRPMPACAVTQALERQSQAGPPAVSQSLS